MNKSTPDKTPKQPERTSVLLKRISSNLAADKVYVGILLYQLRRRSFGGLLFFLSILSLIPGISIFSGILMMILSVQLSLGFRVPLLPRFISEYSVKADYLKILLDRTAPKIEKAEKYIHPRLLLLTQIPFTLAFGVLIFCLAAVIIVPLPFTNLVPALAISVIALGFVERDGLLMIAGATLSVVAIAIGWAIIYMAVKGFENIL